MGVAGYLEPLCQRCPHSVETQTLADLTQQAAREFARQPAQEAIPDRTLTPSPAQRTACGSLA
jgi:hypothetical protein